MEWANVNGTAGSLKTGSVAKRVAEIVDQLEAALEEFRGIEEALGVE